MDSPTDERHVFNYKLLKLVGLNKFLNPNTTRLYKYKVYHIIVVIFCVYIFGVTIVRPYEFYRFMNDPVALFYHFGLIEHHLFSVFKVLNCLYYSEDLWKFIDNTRFELMSYGHYNKNIFKQWQKHSVKVANIYFSMMIFILVIWVINPFLFSTTTVTMRNLDNSYNYYRVNIFNFYVPITDELYNKYFIFFYILELFVLIFYWSSSMTYDIYMIMACYTLVCQLEMINDGLRTMGHNTISAEHFNSTNMTLLEKESDTFGIIRTVMIDHQNLIKNLNDYYNASRVVLLAQICVSSNSHVLVWFILAKNYFGGGEMGDSVLTMRILTVLPMFSFQLFMTCYFFGLIKEKRDSIIFALYSSNWTLMDMNSKKLILLAMKINNAIQIKMQFTQIKIVNLEMFTNTMRICYSVFSMLVNYNTNSSEP